MSWSLKTATRKRARVRCLAPWVDWTWIYWTYIHYGSQSCWKRTVLMCPVDENVSCLIRFRDRSSCSRSHAHKKNAVVLNSCLSAEESDLNFGDMNWLTFTKQTFAWKDEEKSAATIKRSLSPSCVAEKKAVSGFGLWTWQRSLPKLWCISAPLVGCHHIFCKWEHWKESRADFPPPWSRTPAVKDHLLLNIIWMIRVMFCLFLK